MERKKVWIYCRVASPDNTALTMQKESLISYAESNGMEVCGTITETAGGMTLSRTGLNEINKKIQSEEIHCLMVKDISRLGRDMLQVGEYMEWLKKSGVELICMNGLHCGGDFMRQFLDSLRVAIT